MCKGKGLWLCIVATLTLTTAGIAQDKNRNPDGRQLARDRMQRAVQDRMENFVKHVTDPLVQRVSKSVIQGYNLDQTAVSELRQSIQESAEVLLKQPEGMLALTTAARKGNYTKMLETLLSHPNCKTTFAKYLNEEQLQEYMDFTLAREQRDRQVVARHLAAWLDQQLSLTVDQREKIEQRLNANAEEGRPVSAGDMLWNRPRPVDVVRQRFDAPPDDVLSQTQSAIWKELIVPPRSKNEWRVEGEEDDDRKEMFAKAQAEIIEAAKAGKITREEVGHRLETLKTELWGEDKDDVLEPQEKMRWIAEAKLAAHTEQLGPLDESASLRLALVTKGVVEEYLEAQGEDWKDMYEEAKKEIIEAVETSRLTREQAAQRLEGLKKRIDAEERAPDAGADITHHPLYQQTIEDVLSDEAFAQYKALQADRQVFRGQALRDVLVASMDAELFLSDEQRKHFETTFAELSASSATDEVPAPVYMAHQLFQRTDRELLSPWQQEEFERIYRKLESELKFVEKR